MKDWIEKLNAFLKFSEYEILTNAGKISHEVAEALALGEYEKYKKNRTKTTFLTLTGEPGSGKTHTINEYTAYLRSRGIEPAITASTGIAATHIGGMTIHSWSGIGIKTKLDKHELNKIASSQYVAKRVRRTKVLIIEEVSMLTNETLSMKSV